MRDETRHPRSHSRAVSVIFIGHGSLPIHYRVLAIDQFRQDLNPPLSFPAAGESMTISLAWAVSLRLAFDTPHLERYCYPIS